MWKNGMYCTFIKMCLKICKANIPDPRINPMTTLRGTEVSEVLALLTWLN